MIFTDTPILNFLMEYSERGVSRLHMPGHKGHGPLGLEKYDITEVHGADSLYFADGIIAQSERNAAELFGTGKTLYSTEGSSQCIRAMLCLAAARARHCGHKRVRVLASRTVHKTFVTACALLDIDPEFLFSPGASAIFCGRISPCDVDAALSTAELEGEPFAAVYLTSPDYLGFMCDIEGVARVCHARGVPLLVDNAHGSYLRFIKDQKHPIEAGADVCCDSAHKTLPALTGAAYLHISRDAPVEFAEGARSAMSLFGSTSPSYLIMASLDACNPILAGDFTRDLELCASHVDELKKRLASHGFKLAGDERIKLTIDAYSVGLRGDEVERILRERNIECEFADPDFAVMMFSPSNGAHDFDRVYDALSRIDVGGRPDASVVPKRRLPMPKGERVMSVRRAVMAPHVTLPVREAVGMVVGSPSIACPPAIPILISGERVKEDSVELMEEYGIETVEVVAK